MQDKKVSTITGRKMIDSPIKNKQYRGRQGWSLTSYLFYSTVDSWDWYQ